MIVCVTLDFMNFKFYIQIKLEIHKINVIKFYPICEYDKYVFKMIIYFVAGLYFACLSFSGLKLWLLLLVFL